MAKFQVMVVPLDHPDPLIQTYEHISKLNYGMPMFYETLQYMYPIVGS